MKKLLFLTLFLITTTSFAKPLIISVPGTGTIPIPPDNQFKQLAVAAFSVGQNATDATPADVVISASNTIDTSICKAYPVVHPTESCKSNLFVVFRVELYLRSNLKNPIASEVFNYRKTINFTGFTPDINGQKLLNFKIFELITDSPHYQIVVNNVQPGLYVALVKAYQMPDLNGSVTVTPQVGTHKLTVHVNQ